MDAVKGLLVGTASARPLLLLIEDLHWIDAETQALLDELVDSLPGHMLLLVSHRPEYRHSWAGKKRFQTVRVPPLTATGSGKLMDSLLGTHASLDQLKRFLMPRAGGNPLFLEESIRSLLENGLLVDRLGDYRLNQSFGEAPSGPTPTVQAIIASRIDRLPPMDKRLLQVAAVIGRDVPLASLKAIADLTDAELDGAIARLEAANFLRRTRVRKPAFAFKHDLTHEVVYGSLVQDRRMDLHARVMAVTERLYAERLEEHLDVLAWHALKGKLWGEAVRYLRRAASKDLLRSLYRSAKASLELAISALTHLPASADNRALAIALRLEMRLALLPLGEQDNLEKILLEAHAIGKELGDVEWLGRISNFLTSMHVTKGDHVRGLALGADASCQSGDAGVKALGLTLTATCHQALGRHGEAVHFFREAMASVSGPLAHYRFDQVVLPSVLARGGLAISLAEIGAFDEALKVGEEGLRLAEEGTAAADLALALMGIGRPYLRRGDVSKAEPLFERAVHICRTFELSHYLVSVAPALAATQILAGRPRLAIDLLQPVKELAEKGSMFSVYAFTVATLSEAMFRVGDEDRALDLAQLALNFARTRQHRGFEAWTLRLLGEITMRRKMVDLDVSKALFREALSAANECGMWPLIAHCHLGLSNVFCRSRNLSEARGHQRIAANLYRRLGMQFLLWRREMEIADK
jgi:tetratricopeptide (TPR) repeat protein